jgi:TolB protein
VDWSPDGTRFLFTRLTGAGSRVFVVGSNGTGLAQLTNTESRTPRWSPDGSRIAFAQRSASNQLMEIAVMNADGSNLQYLTANQSDDLEPSWSPDGAQIVYSGSREGRPRLFVIGADGTGDRLLTTTVPANHLYDDSPAWSRDGGLIAFSRATSSVDGTTYSSGIYTIRPDSSGLTPLVTGSGAVGSPRWRP